MEESLKSRIILILLILNLIFFVWAIGANSAVKAKRTELDKERSLRIGLEEEKENFLKNKTVCEQRTKSLQEQLEATQKALTQEELASKALKEELEKVTKLKDTLEENLKNALIKQPAEPAKK